jgi:hypothetical protein
MRFSCWLPLLIGICTESVYSLQGNHISVTKRNVGSVKLSVLSASNKDDEMATFTPETAFGAEIVPEGQRPVNEYLDMIKAPLFGWASQESGTMGVS